MACGAIAVLVLTVLPVVSVRAATEPYSVVATPVAGLGDGQAVTLTVKTEPGITVYEASASVCRAGVAYPDATDSSTRPAESLVGGANCPSLPVSSSADTIAVLSGVPLGLPDAPDERTFTLNVGVGTATWNDAGTDRTLTCGPTDPCSLVVRLKAEAAGPGSARWVHSVQTLTYGDADPLAACGSFAPGFLKSGGSERISTLNVRWTLDTCTSAGRQGRSTSGVFIGEGRAVEEFTAGRADLAYTALGYDVDAGLISEAAAAAGLRPAVPVPIAVNATVLAVNAGAIGDNGARVPYTDIRLTLDEVAVLLSGGKGFGQIGSYLDAIYARNPQLRQTGFFTNAVGPGPVQASSEAEATSWLMGRHLETLRPAAWTVPDHPVFGAERGLPRGADASLALATPSFANALNLFSSRSALEKDLLSASREYGGLWVLTDLATARDLGLTPVQIENAAGEFVAPTPESLSAAVSTLQPTAAGTLVPDPTAAAATGGGAPYPLTFVEYALAPAEALSNDLGCATESQALLTDWLTYITGPGQAGLPDGFEALPPMLASSAAALIPTVGATPTPGCTPGAPPPPAPGPPVSTETNGGEPAGGFDGGGFGSGPVGPGSGIPSSGGVGTPSLGGTSGLLDPTETGDGPADASAEDEVELASSATEIPDFAGNRSSNALFTILAFIGIVGLTSVAAMASAGRRASSSGATADGPTPSMGQSR